VDVLRGHRLEVWRLALLPDDKTLVSGCKDGTVCFWDTSVPHLRQPRKTIPEKVVYWGFAPDNRSVLTLNKQGQLSRWSGSDFQQKEPLLGIGTNFYASGFYYFHNYCFSQYGDFLAVGSTNGVLQIWDVARRVLCRQWTNTTGLVVPSCFLADGNKLVTASMSDNLFHEWDLMTDLEMQSWQGLGFPYCVMVLSPDERFFMAINYEGDVVLRNLTDEGNTKVDLDVLEGVSGGYSPDGKLFAVASEYGYARVWDTASWQEVATLRGYLLCPHSVAFPVDGKRLATGGDDIDALKLWDTESWHEVLTLKGQGSLFRLTAFSPDGNAIGTMNVAGTVHLWRAPSWEEINAAEAKEKIAVGWP
jgi:WD40 repeat protein